VNEESGSPPRTDEGEDRRDDSTLSVPAEHAALNRLAAGTRLRYLGDYEILEEIDRGGMGVVYRARQTSLDRLVAIKVILQGEFATEAAVRRFRREAEAAAQLDHPNIVPIYEVGEHESTQYFSMKLVEGSSLRELATTFTQQPRATAELMAKIARAVDHAHRCGVVHRDLKPANILIGAAGEPHVTDFGLARRFTDPALLAMSTSIAGTPSYMAPEQAAGAPVVTTAVDVYALGAILYELLAGQPPFSGDSILETLRHVIDDEPPRPSQVRRGVERDLEAIALRCMEKRPEMRYRTAGDVADDLARFLRGEPIHARPITWRYRSEKWMLRHRTAMAVSLAAIVLLTGAVAGWSSLERRAAHARQGDRIRAVLEESIATNASRESLSTYWPSFEEDLKRYSSESNDERLHQLLRRNVIQVRADVNSFGRVADPPKLTAQVYCNPAPVGVVARGRLEGSWDGGPWVPLLAATCNSGLDGFGGFTGGAEIVEVFGREAINEGPHRLALRTAVDVYALETFAEPPPTIIAMGKGVLGPGSGFPALVGKPSLASETRDLGNHPVHLFAAYPDSFPERLSAAALPGESFALRKLRFVFYEFRPEDTGCFTIRWPTIGGHGFVLGNTICRPEWLESPRTLVVIEWAGEFDLAVMAPLAGEASFLLGAEREPVAAFDFAAGAGRYFSGDRATFWSSGSFGPEGAPDALWTYLNHGVAWSKPPGTYAAAFVLDPSREVALATSRFDRYVDSPFEITVAADVIAARRYPSPPP
jgi:serine/threonine protein kinase